MSRFAFLALLVVGLQACKQEYTPKPNGYPRIEFPEKSYVLFDDEAPYSFEYPAYAEILPNKGKNARPYWYNINFPGYEGTLYLTYHPVNNNLAQLMNEGRNLSYKHSPKADGIQQDLIYDSVNHVYGIHYDVQGNVASAVQFFVTDSVSHFLFGSLYFYTEVNRDSLNPLINFISEDIDRLIETVRWK